MNSEDRQALRIKKLRVVYSIGVEKDGPKSKRKNGQKINIEASYSHPIKSANYNKIML
ncbi:hypothetical protein [Candidatus Paracaedibacter symbiosus]|uniref:hypothetical protein n=1 Tax=Candidatus Paracaedibacter symbiosus TaxID=244582 RepID=UPI0012EC4FB3|nr:hypothetical protein [Candidatus Paracaedibacter symbiosus]